MILAKVNTVKTTTLQLETSNLEEERETWCERQNEPTVCDCSVRRRREKDIEMRDYKQIKQKNRRIKPKSVCMKPKQSIKTVYVNKEK